MTGGLAAAGVVAGRAGAGAVETASTPGRGSTFHFDRPEWKPGNVAGSAD